MIMIPRAITAVGLGLIGGAASLTSSTITEATHIPLGGALAVFSVVATGTWYLSSRLTKIEDGQEAMRMEAKQDLQAVKDEIKALPCLRSVSECNLESQHHIKPKR